ncbi:cyclic nucleotide-binding-like protein [Lobosporangium transversale]|uniref:cAMP-dependent protein kinase regulatory subunit n=1 Tax=Lobosporangium transversale TaxID=64571 RepID=A0A1Y2GLM0_9FUNG|nr:cyclic nucleotide-binding-like protein [Lobosporangium transversale]ORZ14398.1 cyclic nucleotide-binding-like protein [Lobosporangium transversale]|eukprot:XP_021880876.1 cyclic nucleotide-binding-like protein [Lobosporangium transversale]
MFASSTSSQSPIHRSLPQAYAEILNDLNQKVIAAQPQDVLQFCANYFNSKLEEQRVRFLATGEDSYHAHILSFLPPVPPPTLSVSSPNNGSPATSEASSPDHPMGSGSGSESDDEDPDEPSPLLAMPPNYMRGRRTSVSAESMVPNHQNYVKVVIPKTEEQRRRIEASISNNFLFKNLDEDQHEDVVNAMTEKRFHRGDNVIEQGAVGDFFYVVETGTLDVFVAKHGNPAEKVFEYGPGGSFGELALMYNGPRAATVTATSDVVLWALDRITFRRILMENTSRKRRMYEAFLETVPLLMSLEPYERHKIADALESVYFDDGQIVVKQGDQGTNFFIIESGEATVTKCNDEGVEYAMPGLGPGQYFGELALLNDMPRAATVRAKGRLKCATLGKRAFVRLLGPVVEIIKRNSDNYQTIEQQIQQQQLLQEQQAAAEAALESSNQHSQEQLNHH